VNRSSGGRVWLVAGLVFVALAVLVSVASGEGFTGEEGWGQFLVVGVAMAALGYLLYRFRTVTRRRGTEAEG